jgi:hypothetical protein
VEWDCDRMNRWPVVPQPDVAAFLTDHPVAELFERTDQTLRGNSARQLHAASTGINSSFT